MSEQFAASAQLLVQIEQGRSQSDLLAKIAQDRPAIQHFSSAVLRQWGLLRKLRSLMLPKPPEPLIAAVMDLGMASLLEEQGARNEFTVVDEAVRAIALLFASAGPASQKAKKGLVNAVLRRFLRERKILLEKSRLDLQARYNLPLWWIDAVKRDYPEDAENILAAQRSHAPMILRANLKKLSIEAAAKQLADADMKADLFAPAALRLETACSVDRVPGFSQGHVSVQDLGAQLAAPLLLAACPSDRPLVVLDACAAPGGKTGHLLECLSSQGRLSSKVVAMDNDPIRLDRVLSNAKRLGLSDGLTAVCADAGDSRTWPAGSPTPLPNTFDAMLLDVPCSASGIVSRHPDIAWLRRRGDIATLGLQQMRLLKALWPLLAPGGTLLYVTCSIFHPENDVTVQAFASQQRDCERLATALPSTWASLRSLSLSGGKALQLLPTKGLHDGFFYALLRKKGT